ncbi:microcystin-dependent protein [Plasticicumulans lactativorans]|uniref:Microcystin-dependent protein n=1 Tax=Plasticicumulans lactativorans TaxID=1133106 RepID=A0A4R2LBL6_9GAMM|nr:tail fiber protein [Plasticicumulans lactativorans]TCO81695.1 microcystin-dependent protein [Plasticicumulans lactativorans]
MADPFIGEIKMFGGNFAPRGWATCDGQLLSIAQNSALFSLIGTTYGGDGINTFALPDLRGRVAAHASASLPQGALGGAETVTLTAAQLPAHSHAARCAAVADRLSPAGAYWAGDGGANVAAFNTAANGSSLSGAAIGSSGAGQAHDNLQPFLATTFIIALEGIYPSRP